MKPFMPSLLMLANAALVFVAVWSGDKPDDTLTIGILYAAALGFMALLLFIRPGGKVAIMGRGIAVAILAILGFFGLFAMVAMVLLQQADVSITEIAFAAALLAIQFLLLRELRLDEAHRVRGRVRTGIAAVVAGASFLMLFFVGTLAHNVVGIALLIPRFRADSVMRGSVPRIQACAVASSQRNGGYPASLMAMGPPPSGDGCLDTRYASGKVGRVSVSYRPGSADPAGRVPAYQVFARANSGLEDGEPQMAFGDQSGILRAGDSADTPAKLKIIHGGMLVVRSVRACAEHYRHRVSPDSAYPSIPKELYPRYQGEEETEENLRSLGCSPSIFPSFNPGSRSWNVGTYTPVGDSARPTDYVLEIRPRVYGVTGVRSIRTTARGPVYSTVENRAATDADPLVPPCAYEVEDGHCAPDPGGVRARVDVVLPDTATAGEAFSVTAVDRRPASDRNHSYQYRVMCKHRMYVDREPPATYTLSPSAHCTAEPESQSGSGNPVWIRVWVRDYAGTETSIDRRVYLAVPDSANAQASN